MRTLKVTGTGEHHLTKLLDAETGEDIGLELGVSKIILVVGDGDAYPAPRLIIELMCPVVVEVNSLRPLSAPQD